MLQISPFANNPINNQMKIDNPLMMNNLMNNPMVINNMANNQMGMNNMIKNPMGINNMMGDQIMLNNMMANQMNMNNMMNNHIQIPNMMNNPIGLNNMMNNPIGMNNMMSDQIIMNNMANIGMPFNNQMIMNKNLQNQNNIPLMKKAPNKERKIPDILLKNKNKKIERITFQVEKDKKPTDSLFYNKNAEGILNDLFQKLKQGLNEKGKLVYLNENEPMEILHHKFDTEQNEFYNYEKKSLIQGLILAYKNHFPITVSPDMIWLLILQGYSRFMDKYHELVREQYVNFEGQKTLHINRYGTPVKSATAEDWDGIIDECVEQIGDHIGEEMINNLQSDFSTTNAATLLASQASIMSAMKHYFKFEVLMGGCGISYITLEGSLEDWEKIKTKLNYLSKPKFALNWWIKHLIPIIDNIIKTKKYYNKNQKINNELKDFWKSIIRVKGEGGFYDPHKINGWIVKFIPNLNEEHPSLYEEMDEREVPDQIISCPLKIMEDSSNGFKVVYECSIASGFYGMIQDKKTLTVKPVIGYAIVVEKKETTPMTKEDKEEIIKNYFS